MLNLSEESKYLINYYDKLIKISNKNFLFSGYNKKYIQYDDFQKQIFKLLDNIYNLLNIDLQNISKFRRVFNNNMREYKTLIENVYNKHFINNKYINVKIIDFIRNKQGSLIIYQLPFKNKTISINLVKYSKITPKHLENLDNLIKNMMMQIYLIDALTKNNTCSVDSLNIYLFLTPFKRELEKSKEKVLGPSNVNGGFCYGCISNGEIVVYRQEEVFKVFTHELIHNNGFDAYIWEFMSNVIVEKSKQNKMYNNFLNNFKLSREIDLGIQESIVEFWGEFFNNAIYSFIYSKNSILSTNTKTFEIYKKNFETIMNYEIIHSFLQCTKILDHNNLDYIDILSTNAKSLYKEHTHVISYYILKLYLLFDYKEFINCKISINRENMLVFSKSLNNMQKFLNYIISKSKDNSIIKNFKYMKKVYMYIKSVKNKDIYLLANNLYMSTLEYY